MFAKLIDQSYINIESKLKLSIFGKVRTFRSICKPRHWNFGIGIGIGTDITNVIISSSIRPMDPNLA